jgi:hypothetical protein
MMLIQSALFMASAFAQNGDQSTGVLIVGQPMETVIQLKGAYTFLGRVPFSISQNLSGRYELSASKRGYESKSMELYFGKEPFREITIYLQPISRWKAGYRSLLVPGWGQQYKGAGGRGLLFTGLAVGAGIGTLVTHLGYNADLDDLDKARQEYERNRDSFDQAQAAYQKWQSAYRDAQNSYDRRRRSLMITAVIWSINFLDALLMPPGPGSDRNPQTNLSGRIGFNQSQLELHFSF